MQIEQLYDAYLPIIISELIMNIYLRMKSYYNLLKGKLYRSISRNISKTSFIGRNVQILGLKNVCIGKNCVIGDNTTITVNDRTISENSLIIGNNTYIGRNNFIAVGKSIEIKEYCIFGNNCAIMCSDHDFSSPLIPYAISGVTTHKKYI